MTWEEREKQRAEQEEMAWAKKQAQILRVQFKKELEQERQQAEQERQAASHDTAEFGQQGRLSEKSAKSIASFSKLSQPKTIPY